MKINGIIFDFDGTLFDSMSIWETAATDYLSSLKITAEQDLNNKLKAMSLKQSAEYLKESYSLKMTIDEIMHGINKAVEDFYFFTAMPRENVVSVIEMYKNKGIKMCIATATERYQVEEALKRCNMLDYFESIFTCTEVGCGKEEPHIYDYACKSMELDKSETAVFEDAFHAVCTAKKAGYFVIGIYDRYENRTDEVKKIADIYVNSFLETDTLFNI